MPTRSFGDLRLKHAEFNLHTYSPDLGYRNPIPKYGGPYITHEPDIQVFDLNKEDAWIVLASDGLWDEIPRKRTPIVANEHDSDHRTLAENLLREALEHISKEKRIILTH